MRTLPDGLDFLLRPVHAGMCKYESLRDGSLTLEDIFLMNAYLDNADWNRVELMRLRNGERH